MFHTAWVPPTLWFRKCFVLFKFRDYTKLNLIGGEKN